MSDTGFDDDLDDGPDDGPDPNKVQGASARAVLEYLVGQLVDDAEAVEVEVGEGRRGLSLEVRCAPGDMGRLIGRRGRTAQAIRTVVRAAAAKDGVDADVEFVD